jgi:spoIIIJ-associated protein
MAEVERAIEATGSDVEDAIAAGLARLGVDRDAVEIDVLDEGSRGLFGLGTREACVRLSLKATPEVEPEPVPESTELADAAVPPAVEPVEVAVVEPAVVLADVDEDVEDVEKDQAEVAQGVLLELLALLDMEEARVEVQRAKPGADGDESPVVLDVRGSGVDSLIGRRGDTLAALQLITRLIVGREVAGRVRLVVDVGGFKARREKSLRRLAQRMAEQAVRTDRTVVLEPMSPYERRIIHVALREHPQVTTESIGEGNRRKVTIIPR